MASAVGNCRISDGSESSNHWSASSTVCRFDSLSSVLSTRKSSSA